MWSNEQVLLWHRHANAIKKKFVSKYCSVVSSGTAALHLVGKSLKWSSKDTVITTPITFLATSNAILYCGASPSFVDVDPSTFNICPKLTENAINSNTKAIIVVHYGGNACDMNEFLRLKRKHKLFIIEDAAHGFMGKYKK